MTTAIIKVTPEYRNIGCLLCGDSTLEPVYSRPDYTLSTVTHKLTFDLNYHLCQACGLVFMSPQLHQRCWDQYILNTCFTTMESVDLTQEAEKLKSAENDFLSKQLNSNCSVFEIGCGDGRQLYYLQKTYGCKVIGIDLSQKFCNYATEQLGLDARNISLENFSAPEQSYELIFSKHVFEHLCDPLAGLRKVRRLLKDDGAFILEVPSVQAVNYSLRDMFAAHNFLFSPNNLRTLFARVGFSVESSYEQSELFYILRKIDPQPEVFASDYKQVKAALDESVPRYQQMISGATERLLQHLQRWREGAMKVVIFGGGEHTDSLFETFDFSGCDIRFLVDSNRSLRGGNRCGYQVLHPDDLANEVFDEILISSFVYQEQIAEQLDKLGVNARICRIYANRK